LTIYDKDYFMLAKSPNGRTNIGTRERAKIGGRRTAGA
jgi:hypothetical protein